ncbi:DUF3429 domain-containing protein [Sphingomonas arenae]|uniref:DUF3429 domain-containing protein n=1 Tax=Sphingomonas arenae TaxID=2812555 RepID=UPI0023509CC4|nr:DUF3429 domain-containing protein [Sphingomonas arenae]
MGRVPLAPMLLGVAGLIPPVLLAIIAWFDLGAFGPVAAGFLFTYAALIFAFLGGTWWAFACREDRPRLVLLVLAVAPPLLAWGLLPARPQTLVGYGLAALILLSPGVDALLRARGLTPRWWLRLRVPLSVVLALCVAAATYASTR